MISEYEIIRAKNNEQVPEGYEEITIKDFLERENATENEKKEFYLKYGFSVNIHKILSDDTIDDCMDLVMKRMSDPRLEKLNAIVFLLLKPKGSRNTMKQLTDMLKYKKLIKLAIHNDIKIGFDSCGANKFLEAVKDSPQYPIYSMLAEPCESACFSIYINVRGEMYPCSFGEGAEGWETGIDVVNCGDFLKEVWYNPRVEEWRNKNIANCRNCIFYEI